MKALRLDLWATSLQQSPRNTRLHLLGRRANRCGLASTATSISTSRRAFSQSPRPAASQDSAVASSSTSSSDSIQDTTAIPRNFPSHESAARSAKLAALHARLSLPTRLPLKTLARCLVDPSVDPRPGYNNGELSILGQELLGYYTSEHLICHYPRLPMSVLLAAQYAYVGPATLASMRKEWGVEVVAAPGPEVDAGLLQLKRQEAGNMMGPDGMHRLKDMPQARTETGSPTRPGWWQGKQTMTSRILHSDQFGDVQPGLQTDDNAKPFPGAPIASLSGPDGDEHLSNDALSTPAEPYIPTVGSVNMDTPPATVEAASASFVRALAGALYLHAGSAASKNFHAAHVLSRHLALHQLFNFTYPTRDLSRLCAREGFEPPVARLISETGRLSRTPVFVVGVFSGDDKLGEAAGASLNEARVRAAAAALRSWYLYSPPDTDIVLPSEVEGADGRRSGKVWKAQMVDPGEIIT